jgi:heptosyltransferase-2
MRIALINVLNLGDNLVFLPIAQGIRELLPNAEILILTSEVAVDLYDPAQFRAIVLRTARERHVPFWRRPTSALKFLSTLGVFSPDAVLVSHAQPNIAHIAAWYSRASLRIGGYYEGLLSLPCLTHSLPLVENENMAVQNWKLFQSFCSATGHSLPSLVPAKPTMSHLVDPIAQIGGHIVLHPGASQLYQRWPLDRYVELAKSLAVHGNVYLILDSASELPAPDVSNLHFVAARDLKSLIGLLRGAKLFVGNNSGPMHIAAALGIPSIVITGPSNRIWDPFWRTSNSVILEDKTLPCIRCERPVRPLNRCVNTETPMACMKHWTPTDVLGICNSILESSC